MKTLFSLVLACAVLAAPAAGWLRTDPPDLKISADRARAAADILDRIPVRTRGDVPGYDRSCSRGHACSFGPAWNDNTDVPLGRNGCDTANDIRREQLDEPTLRDGSSCVVLSGRLKDPYTGAQVTYQRSRNNGPNGVQLDHIRSLKSAWDAGASTWSPTQRAAFANHPGNLYLVRGTTNALKSDMDPAAWLATQAPRWPWRPPRAIETREGACNYAVPYVEISGTSGLSITPADKTALANAINQCPTEGRR